MTPTSQPAGRREPVNLERTRQQLRELDSLLQQMLALPLDGAPPEPQAAPPTAPPVATEGGAAKRLRPLPGQTPALFEGEPGPAVRKLVPLSQARPQLRPYAPPAEEETTEAAAPKGEEPALVAPPSAPAAPEPVAPPVVIRVQTSALAPAPAPPPAAAPAKVPDAPALTNMEVGGGAFGLPLNVGGMAPPPAPQPPPPAPQPPPPAPTVQAPPAAPEPPAVLPLVRPTFGPPPLRPAAEAPGPITLPFTPPAAPAWDIHQLDLTGPGQMDVSAEQDLQQLVGAAPPPPPPGPFLRLLLAMNRVIDRLILFLGPLGTPLVTPAGRNLMGWIGLVCLVGAVALLAGGWLGRLR